MTQILTMDEESRLVTLIAKFEDSGQSPTREHISDWVAKTLRLRKENNKKSGRTSIRLSKSALNFLSVEHPMLSGHWFLAFYLRNPTVQPTYEDERPMSLQRVLPPHQRTGTSCLQRGSAPFAPLAY